MAPHFSLQFKLPALIPGTLLHNLDGPHLVGRRQGRSKVIARRRRDKARIVIDIDMTDDSPYEEQTAEDKRSNNHCNHRNRHSHSDDDIGQGLRCPTNAVVNVMSPTLLLRV
ncbi:hypothetical protein E4U13_000843 [Claviceps humidiphila]|uniref:Uncharacterized protein n=1 Tax=Claviceps humidiphila TaxID=1294629 RepID=A0A9P7Q338_9HYPO|nr:hypothetical protein E4U13_000843 [Claviceps humidiphila]